MYPLRTFLRGAAAKPASCHGTTSARAGSTPATDPLGKAPAAQRHRSRWTSRGAAGASLALAFGVMPLAGSASADGTCATSAATTTCSFGYTGAEQTFTVPAGVSSVTVSANGAAGGADFSGRPGGRGASVTGTLTGLTAGQVLYVEVGQRPDTASTPRGTGPTAFNGGGAPGFGSAAGGGGGASDVRTVSTDQTGSLTSRLIIAGGGGGHSESYSNVIPAADAGADAAPASATTSSGQGGFTGTQNSGGAGGQGATFAPGLAGSLGQGGAGGRGFPSAGGGGGGLYGGGGGGSGGNNFNSAAGGGGGGSSLLPAGGSMTLTTDPASVTITYTSQVMTSTGFYAPVDGGGVYNTVKGGSSVPLKFNVQIDGVQQTSNTVVTGFTATRIACDGSAATDDVELVTTGATALRYDSSAGQFIQVWKTPTGAGTCYRATITLSGGGTIDALFTLK